MKKRYLTRSLLALGLVILMGGLLVGPVFAAEFEGGEVVVIDQDVNDDLYVAGGTITVNATIHGDLIAAGGEITVNGTVEGDFMGAGGRLHINGTVADDVRFAGGDLRLGPGAEVGDDVFAAGFGFTADSGSSIGGDLFVAGYQAQLGGDIAEDVQAALAGLEISGHIVGNVNAEVAEPDPEFRRWSPFMSMWMGPWMPAEVIGPGLRIADEAQIDGDLTYTSAATAEIPAEVVGGAIVYQTPVPEEVEAPEVEIPEIPAGAITLAAIVGWFVRWVVGIVRTFVTLLIIGVLLLWLTRKWLQEVVQHWKEKPLHSLGWGVAALLAFLVAVPSLFVAMIILDIVAGLATLGGLLGPITGIFMVLEGALVVGFSIMAVYVTKVAFSYLIGWLILKRTAPAWVDRAMGVIPFLIGLAIFVAGRSVPFLGSFLSFLVTIFGLGAIWLLAWARIQKRRERAKA
jgi:hypothetical protein